MVFQKICVINAISHCSSNFVTSIKEDLDLWQCRLEHNNEKDVLKLSKSVECMKLNCSNVPGCFCDIYAENKMNRKPFNSKSIARKSSKLELVCSDVRGPMETTSLGGQRYVVSFIDSCSRFARAYFMKISRKFWICSFNFVSTKACRRLLRQ